MLSIEKIENELYKEVLNVLNLALSNKVYDKPIIDDKQFFEEVIFQGIPAIVIEALDKKNISSNLFKHIEKTTFNFILKDVKQQNVIKIIKETLKKNQIPFLLLKGAKLKTLYKETYMRGMGDIDVLVDSKDIRTIETIFKEKNIYIDSKSPQHDVYQTIDEVFIEVHPTLYNENHLPYSKIFKNTFDYVFFDENFEGHLDHSIELIYLVYHLAKHFRTSGIGIRSILDISFYLDKYEDKINKENLKNLLVDSNLDRFYHTLIELCNIYFGKNHDLIFDYNKMNEKVFNDLTVHIMKSGIHGKGKSFNTMTPRVVSSNNNKRLSALFKTLFLPYKSMKVIYPILNKMPFLLPMMYIVHIFKRLFKKRSYVMVGKILKKDEINDMDKLFNYLNLK